MSEEPDKLTGLTMNTLSVGRGNFPTTRWTLVVAASDPARKESRAALVSLCEAYWYPLYAYVRRRGHSVEEAQDLTQEFFVRILEGRYLDRADREKGRFRSVLLTSLKFFLADEMDRTRAQKRGGAVLLPFEVCSGEELYRRERADEETPESIFERRWAHSVLARFNNERQALALMDHPNVARIYDAGATPKGRPYFVMEYIDGAPITEYCDRRRLTTAQRLELFMSVCRAVQHAHHKGVIHRDIKPSNVLVMEQDGHPVPKVIDFGISKATDQRSLEFTQFTQFGEIVGTPEYMSPEQADIVAGDVDTSSDVYSLGVVPYEMLIGTVPFEAAVLRKAGLAELLRIIREEAAPALSTKLTAMGGTATDMAARRQTDPSTLRRQLAGDLNWIAMKVLDKNRERRYSSVADLAADIQRHLDNQPVLAGPPQRRIVAFVAFGTRPPCRRKRRLRSARRFGTSRRRHPRRMQSTGFTRACTPTIALP